MSGLFQLRFRWPIDIRFYLCALTGIALLLLGGVVARAEISPSVSIGSVLEQAYKLYSEKQFDDALREFEHAVEIDKGSISAWRGLGWTHWAMGHRKQAYQIWTDLIKVFPDDLQTLLALGQASEQDQHWDEATYYYAQVLKLQPHDLEAHKGRARIFIAQRKFQFAEQDSRAALNDTPSDSNAKSLLADALIGQDRYQEAENILRILSRTEPVPANLLRLGKVQAELGKYEQAADAYKTSLSIQADKGTLSAWRRLGDSLRERGENQRAYTIWQNLLGSFPNDLPTLLALGRACEQDQLWLKGLDYYAKVLQESPNDQAAHLGRARIFSANKDYKSAELEIKSILDHSPSNREARFAMADNLVTMGHDEEAERMLRPLVELDPEPKNISRLAIILDELNRDDEAEKYFRKSLQLAPDDAAAILGLAHLYWKQHRYSESIPLLQGYLAKHSDNDIVRARLAEHASAANNWEQAERELRILADKHPDEIKWQVKLASLLHKAGHHEEAVKIATGVITKYPHEVTALNLLADDAIFSGNIGNAIYWIKQLTTVAPTAERLIRLANLHMMLGDQLNKENKQEAAIIQYRAAAHAIEQAATLDPIKTGAPLMMAEALSRQGQHAEAIKLGEEIYSKYPISSDIIKQLANYYREQGDYSAARNMLANNMPFFSNSPGLQQSLAELTYYAGEKDKSFKMLDDIIDSSKRAIPILLYHGISISDRQDTTPLQNFRDQLLALKHEGYNTITLAQLFGFFKGTAVLPAKPIVITFDDARSDSFHYADPVLMETGFQATMFVPVDDVAQHQTYAAVWPTIRKMFGNGRWDIQCHGTEVQHYVPVDAEGHLGHFLANKMWKVDAARLETNAEYAARIERDFLKCQETLAQEVPGSKVFAFAFPYGDQGHRSLSNTPDAFNINQRVVKKHFQLAFNIDNTYLLTESSPRYSLPRFEVPIKYTGKDLVHQLKAIDPALSASYKLARLNVESGHYEQAVKIFDGLVKQGVVDNADLLIISGKALNWSGDHAGARKRLEKALVIRPDSPEIQKEIAALDRRLRPSLQLNGLYFQDNAHRSYYSFSPSVQYPVSDKLSLSAYYKYLDFSQKLNPETLATITREQNYQANGNQFEGQISYELGSRSSVALSAGAADFSGHASPIPSKSGSTFPLGAVKLNAGIGDRFDLSFAADHTYVNTAGAILNGIAFTRAKGGFTAKLLDALSLNANHAYFYYTDHNQRNRTEVELDSRVWSDPDITIGAQFIRDDTLNFNPLFWTPNNYIGLSAPLSLKKKWVQSVVAKISIAPGMGKEAGNDFTFQFNSTGSLNWNLNDDFSVYLSASRYQAATYSNFSAFAGLLMRF